MDGDNTWHNIKSTVILPCTLRRVHVSTVDSLFCGFIEQEVHDAIMQMEQSAKTDCSLLSFTKNF
jgi:hypothetical protein